MNYIIEPTEKWLKYEPSSFLSGKYYLTGITDDLSALNIFLRQKEGQQEINITYVAWSYRNTCETIRMGIVDELSKRYGTEFCTGWSFFKIENSAYIRWLSDQSYGYASDFKMQHFVIMGIDFIVDIVAAEEPKIKLIK